MGGPVAEKKEEKNRFRLLKMLLQFLQLYYYELLIITHHYHCHHHFHLDYFIIINSIFRFKIIFQNNSVHFTFLVKTFTAATTADENRNKEVCETKIAKQITLPTCTCCLY